MTYGRLIEACWKATRWKPLFRKPQSADLQSAGNRRLALLGLAIVLLLLGLAASSVGDLVRPPASSSSSSPTPTSISRPRRRRALAPARARPPTPPRRGGPRQARGAFEGGGSFDFRRATLASPEAGDRGVGS